MRAKLYSTRLEFDHRGTWPLHRDWGDWDNYRNSFDNLLRTSKRRQFIHFQSAALTGDTAFRYHGDRMIRTFKDAGSRDIAQGVRSKHGRRTLPVTLHARARRLIAEIDFAVALGDLGRPSNRLHELTGDRQGQHFVSINDQYRICFRWDKGEVFDVEITDYH